MWQKLKEQVPAIVVTAALVTGASAFLIHQSAARQDASLAPLREQNQLLRAQAAENQRQIETATQMLKEAIAQRGPKLGDVEAQRLPDEQVNQIADTIAHKLQPVTPLKSAADIDKMQEEQIDRVAARLTDNLRPVLAEGTADSRHQLQLVQQKNDELNRELVATRAAAHDALKLTHEVSAQYTDSFRTQGVMMRLMALPAEIVTDAAKGNIITSRDRARIDKELSAKMNEIDARLNDLIKNTPTDRT
jgi:hypothetical protein